MNNFVDSEVKELFDEISPAIEQFAEKYNLLVEKYWHGIPSWRFSFKHPKSGIGCVELIIDNFNSIEIYGYLWIDDYDKGTRSGKTYKSGFIRLAQAPDILYETFNKILGWEFDSSFDVTDIAKNSWHQNYNKEQFLKLNDKYPIPKI